MIDAVIFDFDGVLADTERLHHQAFAEVIARQGLSCEWDTYVRDYIGFDDRDLFRAAWAAHDRSLDDAALAELVQAKAAAFIALTEGGVATYDGVPEVVHAAAARGPVALCSGALRSDIDPILLQLGVEDVLAVRVTAEDVAVSKPDPACYQLAVERLSAHSGRTLVASRCLAIEDTPSGIRSARGAGLQVWAVQHTHAPEALQEADRVYLHVPALMRDLEAVEADD
jgi:beta-phosphoglucomutase